MGTPKKRIHINNLYNFRDLGGFETKSGGVVKWQKLYRSDGLAYLEDAQWQQLKELGIYTVIDLRSKSETISFPDNVIDGIDHYHCPMQKEQIDFDDVEGSTKRAFSKSMTEGYWMMLTNGPELVATAVSTVIEGLKKGSVLFHCTAGKDRTGVLAAVIYTLLGVDREDIIADYQVTHTYNEPGLNRLVREMGKYEDMRDSMISPPEYMEQFLNRLDKINLEELLINNGLTSEGLEYLRRKMLDR